MTKKKLVFLDTNVFTACAASEWKGHDLDVLEKIISKLDKNELEIVVPEVIKVEVSKKIADAFEFIRNGTKIPVPQAAESSGKELKKIEKEKKENIEKIRDEEIEAANTRIKEKVAAKEKQATELLEKIFSHKNCRLIKLTDSALQNGMKRSVLLRRPSSVGAKHPDAKHYIKDIDCIAFESMLEEFGSLKDQSDFIVCSSDPDYYDGMDLHKEVVESLPTKISSARGYKSAVELLEKEFSEAFTADQKKQYEAIEELPKAVGGSLRPTVWNSVIASSPLTSAMFTADSGLLASTSTRMRVGKGAKFCPACGSDIESELKGAYGDSLGYPFGYVPHVTRIISCPHCFQVLEVEPSIWWE